MRLVFAITAVFVLCFVLTGGKISASPLEMERNLPEFSVLSGQPMFSADTDIFLGQKRRRNGGRIWGNFYYGDTTLEPKGGGKINPDFYGIQVGLDFTKPNGIYSTFFFNANQSQSDFIGGTSAIDNFLFGYGKSMYLGFCHLAFTGSAAYDRYEVSAAGMMGTGDGLQTNFFGEFGLDFILGRWAIKPFYALQYDFLYHGNINNNDSVLIGDWNGHGLQQLFGLRLNWKIWNMLELQGRTVWVHEMLSNTPPFYRGRFSPVHGTNTPAIMFYNGDTGRDWAWLGIGAKFEGIYGIYFFGDYDVLLNARHVSHLGSFGLCIGW